MDGAFLFMFFVGLIILIFTPYWFLGLVLAGVSFAAFNGEMSTEMTLRETEDQIERDLD